MEARSDNDPESSVEAIRALAADADARCTRCGYSLRGIAAPRCPECGHALSVPAIRAHLERPSWRHRLLSRSAYAACLALFVISLLLSTPSLVTSRASILYFVLPAVALTVFGGWRRVQRTPSPALLWAASLCWVLVLFVLTRAILFS